MKNIVFILIATFVIFSCKKENEQMQKIELKPYPQTTKENVVDEFFGISVKDPYRWLEDDMSEATKQWVKQQNEVTFDYLSQIPFRDKIKNRLTDVWNYEKYYGPFKKGDYFYFYKNDGLQNQYVLYRQKGDEKPEVFIDPNKFSKDGSASLGHLKFSNDYSKVAFEISEAL